MTARTTRRQQKKFSFNIRSHTPRKSASDHHSEIVSLNTGPKYWTRLKARTYVQVTVKLFVLIFIPLFFNWFYQTNFSLSECWTRLLALWYGRVTAKLFLIILFFNTYLFHYSFLFLFFIWFYPLHSILSFF